MCVREVCPFSQYILSRKNTLDTRDNIRYIENTFLLSRCVCVRCVCGGEAGWHVERQTDMETDR